jgi:hypothetical protein
LQHVGPAQVDVGRGSLRQPLHGLAGALFQRLRERCQRIGQDRAAQCVRNLRRGRITQPGALSCSVEQQPAGRVTQHQAIGTCRGWPRMRFATRLVAHVMHPERQRRATLVQARQRAGQRLVHRAEVCGGQRVGVERIHVICMRPAM